jgi:hypothetical protein
MTMGLPSTLFGFRNSQTISPPGVTSKTVPALELVTSVLPFGKRWDAPRVCV